MSSPIPRWSMDKIANKPWIEVNRVEATETYLTVTCRECKTRTVQFIVRNVDLRRWVAGAHVQDVWPNFSADQRELLISGVCGPCFDAMFGEP